MAVGVGYITRQFTKRLNTLPTFGDLPKARRKIFPGVSRAAIRKFQK